MGSGKIEVRTVKDLLFGELDLALFDNRYRSNRLALSPEDSGAAPDHANCMGEDVDRRRMTKHPCRRSRSITA